MRFQGVDLVVAVLLILPAINAATFRDMILQLFKTVRDSEISIVYPDISDGVRRQPRFAKQIPFPCDVRGGRSASRPDSVHRLRPGDIDVVGALGDSLVAANGAMEEYALGTFIEARGVSWCAGGQGDWRQFLTLPNIMKEFNPNLTGYSTGNGEFISKQAKLNVAFPVAATEDALHQARILVRRIKNDPTIDMKRDWKLVTIFFGANDICSAQCYKPEQFSPSRHALHLRRTLDYLRATLPRTLVNVVPVLDVTVSIRVPTSTMCNLLHPLYCACMHEGNEPDITGSVMSRQYQQAAESLVLSGRYDTTQDFTVVYQPFTELFNAPNSNPRNSEVLDQTLVTYDCFHFSQKGHALGGNLLWNNLLEPVGNKTDNGKPRIMERLVCPSARTPYIFTNVNSRYYYETGNQEGISPR
ncbi:phospholipase B1, membrane-associated-like isoform X1 [Neodiprion fabricii]|uniref:phospholipase B1, membrane-associated-like isoform X1 n=1 Tax=Neodiprion fabricii TaxID=2872261 RepID=UPI001ED93A16|nr:phospholipase B1, membrane-associated-like isoform X1 [Neodiprion fabricii]XP_046416827.1 phospholipase B1, membrane-associated-like isoform X1 [Neodiprion fabricii]XP_046416828.1 phospholipase B1, membrane-associated-like isoform X1 [Neodiprion fabricii]XP_046416829.1 phospholipase B1, membrane-associated-like isoform X1 [Neodiprion fabricii]XP_046416830.1 phospholipase B1, membrane-associated-like isoform X1 [Neodiprion fabricii]XP_046416832.1 phospholipase B1, membrane-associated-like is